MLRQPKIVRSLLLALFLSVGIGTIWTIVSGVCWNWILQTTHPLETPSRKSFLVLQDGTPAISLQEHVDYSGRTRFVSLDHEPLEPTGRLSSARLIGTDLFEELSPVRDWKHRIFGASDDGSPPTLWYLIQDGQRNGIAWFEGFDSVTKRRIGFIGQQGFRPDGLLPDECFPVDGRLIAGPGLAGAFRPGGIPYTYSVEATSSSARMPPWLVYMASKGHLLEIDLRVRSVHSILDEPDLIGLGVVERAMPETSQDHRQNTLPQYLAVRTPTAIRIVDPRSGCDQRFPLPEELRPVILAVFLLPDGLLLQKLPHRGASRDEVNLVWLDEQGRITQRRTESLGSIHANETNSWSDKVAGVVLCPVPLLLYLVPFIALPMEESTSYPVAVATVISDIGWLMVIVGVLAILAALWCYGRQRRYGQSHAVAWFLFVLLLGLPGLLGYLWHRRWPLRLPCPACDQPAPRDRENCAACGHAFPAPAKTGIEVFA